MDGVVPGEAGETGLANGIAGKGSASAACRSWEARVWRTGEEACAAGGGEVVPAPANEVAVEGEALVDSWPLRHPTTLRACGLVV
jgi:hypothetical protein